MGEHLTLALAGGSLLGRCAQPEGQELTEGSCAIPRRHTLVARESFDQHLTAPHSASHVGHPCEKSHQCEIIITYCDGRQI